MDDDREVLSNDGLGRINLPGPTPEQLEAAAEDVLGSDANEAPIGEGKVFRGATGGLFLQGPADPLGENLAAASAEMQEALMAAARKVRKVQAEVEGVQYLNPETNPFIKLDQD